MNRAYSILEIKSIDRERRVFRGTATTPTPDRIGDSINPLGVKFKNPLPLLWQHNHAQPIGLVRFETPTKKGIDFEAEIPVVKEAGPLKDRCDTAWGEIEYGLVRATSVGFLPIDGKFQRNKNGGVDFDETEVFELSAVTIPMNSEALITQVKSIDAALREAAGIVDDPEIPSEPDPQPEGKKAVVVRLGKAAQDRAPFVINKIHTEGKP